MTTYPAISLWQPWATLCATPVECPICHGREPWNCTLSLNGPHMVKRFETRSRPCPPKYIGQRIAIHAAKRRPVSGGYGDFGGYGVDERGLWPFSDPRLTTPLPLGAVVATAIVTASLPIVEHTGDHDDEIYSPWRQPEYLYRQIVTDDTRPEGVRTVDLSDQVPYGDWTPGRWAWQLDDVQPLEQPVPATGRQGWFTVELP